MLAESGICYGDIKNAVILERAKKKLVAGELSIREIAILLRYAHQSGFLAHSRS